jgi:hypothetical protein
VLALIIFLPQPALYMLLIAGVAAPLVMSFLRHRRAELDAGRPELDAAR